MAKTNWRNRVKALEYHVAGDILDHPHQWRTHPAKQAEALRDVPDEDEGKRLLVAFQAVKEAVDAGLPLDVVLTKYLAWSEADVNAMNETQAAQQPDPAEVAARMAMMKAGQQQQGQQPPQQGTPPTEQTPPGAQ